MSDDGGSKGGGYRLEYAVSGRAKCKVPNPHVGTTLEKGSLRFGTVVDFQGNTSFSWRHWGCVTTKVLANIKKSLTDASELDGFEDLRPEDQERINEAWERGAVADEDIPASARKSNEEDLNDEDDDDEGKPTKPKKKAAPRKKKTDNDDDEEPKPKKKAAPRKKVGAFGL
ncbi:poly polymerase and DNA-ligase Zn-finger region-domain-containing protein [Mycena galopus ATCC 62051]|nr:poly polymerase and DNA-ligase Zn-finger region-domain-containing protein [Mycena galopus ATCC 62051]